MHASHSNARHAKIMPFSSPLACIQSYTNDCWRSYAGTPRLSEVVIELTSVTEITVRIDRSCMCKRDGGGRVAAGDRKKERLRPVS